MMKRDVCLREHACRRRKSEHRCEEEWERVKRGVKRTSWRRRRLRAPAHCLGVIGGGGIVAR